MEFFKGSETIVILLFIGGLQASSPYISEKPNNDYSSLAEDFNGIVFRIHLVDADGGDKINVFPNDDKTRTYFTITPVGNSNDIWVNVSVKNGFDRETLGSSVQVNLRINDNQGNIIFYKFTVYIIDINDNIPEFQDLPYNLEIKERPCNKTEVYTRILANDIDSNANGRVTYLMEPKAQSNESRQQYAKTFAIDRTTGHVTLTECLDYETNRYYQFTITAKDTGPNGGLSATAEFIIRVQDVQDQPPFFTGDPYRKTINENIIVGSEIVKVNARDGDPDVSNNVFYTVRYSSCGDGMFKINTHTGYITTSSNIDRDSGLVRNQSGNCILTVLAEEIDKPGEPQYENTTVSTDVTIMIQDIDDNLPSFSESFYNASVPENTPKDAPLLLSRKVIISDFDTGDNALMQITLRNSDNSECQDFVAYPSTIQGHGSITIFVKNTSFLNYEERNETVIKIIATETANASKFAEAEVRIEILDRNDNTLKFSRTSFVFTVNENSANGTFVGQVTAMDANSSPEYKTLYSLSGSRNRFIVDQDTGSIRTNCSFCSIELDREDQDEYDMTYSAKGGDWWGASTHVKVRITDVNDETPHVAKSLYVAFVDENDAQYMNRTPLTQVEASDNDEPGSNNSVIMFSIVKTTETSFKNNLTIDALTGELYLKYPLDYERIANPFGVINVTVKVNDMGTPTQSSTTVVSIFVQDLNDNLPFFIKSVYRARVLENATSDIYKYTNITQVQVTDGDGTVGNNMVNFFITNGGADHFLISPSSGIVSIAPHAKLDRETIPSYNLTILAIDQGSPPLTSTTTLTIDIIDVNDESPVFGSKVYTAMLTEETNTAGTVIANCTAVDPDLNAALEYFIIKRQAYDEYGAELNDSSTINTVHINKDDGSVYISKPLESRKVKVARLTIQVLDTSASNSRQTNDSILFITLMEDIDDQQLSQCVGNDTAQSSTSTPPSTSTSQNWNFESPCNKSGVQIAKFPHPSSKHQLLICDSSGETYLAYCPPDKIYNANCSVCAKPGQLYSASCMATNTGFVNPCTKENVKAGNLTFPHPDSSSRYVRCDTSGNAWVEECVSGSTWDQMKLTCVLPKAYNPCHQRGGTVQSLYPHYCNPRLYVQCDNNGRAFVHTCQKNYVFLSWDLACVPPAFPGSEYLKYTCK